MQLHITPSDGKPIYLQIMQQVKYLIASGRLQPGEELPAVRVLAQRLLINPNTVARAYRELEVEGLLFKRQGAGTYVSEGGSPLARKEQRRIITERTDALLVEAEQMNLSRGELFALIEARYEALHGKQEEGKS